MVESNVSASPSDRAVAGVAPNRDRVSRHESPVWTIFSHKQRSLLALYSNDLSEGKLRHEAFLPQPTCEGSKMGAIWTSFEADCH